MTTVPTNETILLKWKLADGTLKPINELTEEELATSRKICAKRVENYYRNYEFFRDMLEQMDDQLSQRRAKLEAMLQRLKEIESEV
jgi:hypothetical protein